jgi:predicted amidohydrolase
VCQLPVSSDPAINLERVRAALADAAGQQADLAVFPEGMQVRFGSDLRAAVGVAGDPFGTQIGETAGKLGIAAVAGIFEPAGDGRVHNTTVGYDASGRLVASYRKIHVFDSFGQRESEQVTPGSQVVVADLAGLRVGFLTCYDVRFPELARALVDQGAELLVIPAAWGSGLFKEEHWVTLVRARAIENTVWVAAAGQVPDPAERPTRAPTGVGRSMVVDPMGVVRLDLGPYPGIGVAEVDSSVTAQVREQLPSLQHRRPDVFGVAGGPAR